MDTPREPLIEFKGVSKTFGDRNILNRIDLSVYEGEVTTLIGLSGTGRKSAMKKYSKETVVGIFVVIGLLCIGYMTVRLGNVGFLGENTYSLFAKFNTVTGLRQGNPVNMLDLEIGRVEKFTMDQENQVVQVEYKINKGIEIFDDAIASVKTEGLIGDKYVAIDPGGGGDLLANGDTITDTNSPTDIMDLVSKYAFGDVGGGEEEEN